MADRNEYELWLTPDTNVQTHRIYTQVMNIPFKMMNYVLKVMDMYLN